MCEDAPCCGCCGTNLLGGYEGDIYEGTDMMEDYWTD